MYNMTTRFVNTLTVTGTIEEVDLTRGVARSSGRDYIRGTLTIATSDVNMVRVSVFQMFDMRDRNNPENYIPNPRYQDVNRLIDEHENPVEGAIGTPISITGSFDSNVFVNQQGEMIEAVQVGSGFYNYTRTGAPRAEFRTTVVLRGIREEIDRETEVPTGDLIVTGETFSFRGEKVPMRFFVKEGPGADYFQGEFDNGNFPLFTDVWGNIENAQLPDRVIESAFGEPQVVESTFTRTLYSITGAAVMPHEMTEENAEKIKKGAADYEVRKAEAQERADNRQAPSATGAPAGFPGAAAAPSAAQVGGDGPKPGGFQF